MIKILAVIALILLIITAGCGFAIHFGGETFQNGLKGHMVLGVVAILVVIALVVSIFITPLKS